jgi:hypothetical protein
MSSRPFEMTLAAKWNASLWRFIRFSAAADGRQFSAVTAAYRRYDKLSMLLNTL